MISYLSEILVFRMIFERMRRGQQEEQDWFVLLGTLGRLDSDGEILLTILNRYPGYDESTTRENIRKLTAYVIQADETLVLVNRFTALQKKQKRTI